MMSTQQNIHEDFASRFLTEAIRLLESQEPSERNTGGIKIAGMAAWFLSDKGLFHELEQIWSDTPRNDHRAGKELEQMVLAEHYLQEYKIMSQEEFENYLQNLAPEHFEMCSNMNLSLEDVLQTAKSPLDIEEIGCTYAVLGNFELATKIAGQPKLETFHRDGILRTIEMEKLRRGDFVNPDLSILGLRDSGAGPWLGGYVALCALGRLPYIGYPYPDW